MTLAVRDLQDLDPSPIDLVEDLAESERWDVDRLNDDHIAMAIAAAWRTYSVSLAWAEIDETLRMVCTFDLKVVDGAQYEMNALLQAINDRCWLGVFTYWEDQELIAYRYALTLSGSAAATTEQVDAIVRGAVENCERYHPALNLVASHGVAADDALDTALLEAAGRA